MARSGSIKRNLIHSIQAMKFDPFEPGQRYFAHLAPTQPGEKLVEIVEQNTSPDVETTSDGFPTDATSLSLR